MCRKMPAGGLSVWQQAQGRHYRHTMAGTGQGGDRGGAGCEEEGGEGGEELMGERGGQVQAALHLALEVEEDEDR